MRLPILSTVTAKHMINVPKSNKICPIVLSPQCSRCQGMLYHMDLFVRGFCFIPWRVSCAMTRPHCSQPPRAPCYLGAGWSSWPGCWEEMTPWGWCPSPPAEGQTHTGRPESVPSSGILKEEMSKIHGYWDLRLTLIFILRCTWWVLIQCVTISVTVLHLFFFFFANLQSLVQKKTKNTRCFNNK